MTPDEQRPDGAQGPAHEHGGLSEQEARIGGEHGWGYGGRPSGAPDDDESSFDAEEERDQSAPVDRKATREKDGAR